MTFDADEAPELRAAHVIVVANEKGGSGKSTLSIHLAVALMKAGYRVATIDLDIRQRTLTRFFENRASWARTAPWKVELPKHFAPDRSESPNRQDSETAEFAVFAEAIGEVEHDYEFVVIDTPASDSYLMRLAHSLADTLISPMNDSFIDMDVLSRVHHDRSQRGMVAQYAEIVLEARRKRRLVDNGLIDWIMVRNRVATLQTNNARQVDQTLRKLAVELRFRVAEGLHDRVIFRELFPLGLTALDALEEFHHTLTASQKSARREIDALVSDLRLPERVAGADHLESRHIWFEQISDYYRDLGARRGE
ncbi:division plane positioning ATPase MipZ [uncultured Rhodoblastus sp.]|uniref:division plane positioning ATPase MipZ n=1 Tax=uncultured Rhodoblastus sp. TaxID=543037 RepID=UPI0025DE7DA1|nr:division plane positioning ATPase MipZ [uncultured Rhodoblastus sp.]